MANIKNKINEPRINDEIRGVEQLELLETTLKVVKFLLEKLRKLQAIWNWI